MKIDESEKYIYKVKDHYSHNWEQNVSYQQYLTEEDLNRLEEYSGYDRERLMSMLEPYVHDPAAPYMIFEGNIEYNECKVLVVEPGRYPYTRNIDTTSNDDIYNILGGYMERVKLEHGVYALVNECGKVDGLEPNRSLRNEDGKIYDIIHGSFIVIGNGDCGGTYPLTDEQINKYTAKFRECELFMMDQNRNIVSIPYAADDDPQYSTDIEDSFEM